MLQGSGIGPVLFLIYIDDFAKLLQRNGFQVKLFADDVKVYIEVVENTDVAKLQGTLDLVASWASQWQLQISLSSLSSFQLLYTYFSCSLSCSVSSVILKTV